MVAIVNVYSRVAIAEFTHLSRDNALFLRPMHNIGLKTFKLNVVHLPFNLLKNPKKLFHTNKFLFKLHTCTVHCCQQKPTYSLRE